MLAEELGHTGFHATKNHESLGHLCAIHVIQILRECNRGKNRHDRQCDHQFNYCETKQVGTIYRCCWTVMTHCSFPLFVGCRHVRTPCLLAPAATVTPGTGYGLSCAESDRSVGADPLGGQSCSAVRETKAYGVPRRSQSTPSEALDEQSQRTKFAHRPTLEAAALSSIGARCQR